MGRIGVALLLLVIGRSASAQHAVRLATDVPHLMAVRVPAETLFVYGPGGPLPAMKDAATAFERQRGIAVQLTGGPTPQWLERARNDADVVFSGAEHMMTDFVKQLGDTSVGRGARPGRIDESTIVPLYLRPVAMLVRPGSPRGIHRFEDLLRPGMKVLVVQGAGQTGLWEDVAGRTGDIRDAGVALTVKGRDRTAARDFASFLQSPEGARIFAKGGWLPARSSRD